MLWLSRVKLSVMLIAIHTKQLMTDSVLFYLLQCLQYTDALIVAVSSLFCMVSGFGGQHERN